MEKLKKLTGDVSAKDTKPIPAGAPQPGGPVEGWLKKRGDKGIVLGWKPRFFRLGTGNKLAYSKDDAGKNNKGNIDLGAVTGLAFRNDIPNGFVVSVPGRAYILQAANAQDRQDWMNALHAICPKLAGTPAPQNTAAVLPGGHSQPAQPHPQPQPQPQPVAQPAEPVHTPTPAVTPTADASQPAFNDASVQASRAQLDQHLGYLAQVTGAPWQFFCDYADVFGLLDTAQKQTFSMTFGQVIHDGYVRDFCGAVSAKMAQNPSVAQMLNTAVPSRTIRLIIVPESYWNLLVQYGSFSRLRVHDGVLLIEVRNSAFGTNMGTLAETFDPCFGAGTAAAAPGPAAVANPQPQPQVQVQHQPPVVAAAPIVAASRGIFDTFPELKEALDGISRLANRHINFEVDMNRLNMACDKRQYSGRAGEILGWYLKPLERYLGALIIYNGIVDPEFSEHFNQRVPSGLIRMLVCDDSDPTATGYALTCIMDGVLTIKVRESYVGTNVDQCGDDLSKFL